MKVRVKSCTLGQWYKNDIGKVFEIKEYCNITKVYWIKGSEYGIPAQDAEVVEDVKKNCKTCKYDRYNTPNNMYCDKYAGLCDKYNKWQPIEQAEENSCYNCKYDLLSDEHPCNKCSPSRDMWKPIGQVEEVVAGVGQDAPTIVNEKGGKQSATMYAFDCLDPKAMFAMCKVLKEGRDKYGTDENWRKIPVNEHINHALIHFFAYMAGDRQDEHLSHALCRAMFALAVDDNGK